MQSIKLVRTIKQGNSIYIRLPLEYRNALNIRRGDHVVLALYNENTLVARKPTDQELLDLKPKDIQYGL